MFKKVISKIKEYLTYPSTIKGIVMVLGLIGYNIDPAFLDQIILAIIAIVGAIEMLFSDADVVKKKK
jgi:hypothetical protein